MSRASALSRARARTPAVWTPQRVSAVCARHARAEFLKHACALEGGSYIGLQDAMTRDEGVRLAVAQAHALGVALLRRRLDEYAEGSGDWKSAAWLLERFDREAFAPPKAEVKGEIKTEHSGAIEVVLQITEAEERAIARGERPDE